jgi:hypothetical protein
MKITVTHEIEVDQGLATGTFGVDASEVESELRALATTGLRSSVGGVFGWGNATVTRVSKYALTDREQRQADAYRREHPATLANTVARSRGGFETWDGIADPHLIDADAEPPLREE